MLSLLSAGGYLPGCWRPRARRGEAPAFQPDQGCTAAPIAPLSRGDYGSETNAVIWADDVRRDANPANGQLMMPLRQTKEANRFEVRLTGHLEITPYVYVYIFPWKKRWTVRKNRHRK